MYMQCTLKEFQLLIARAKSDVEGDKKVIKDFAETGDTSGWFKTRDVVLSYSYDATQQRVNFEVGQRISLSAHVAPEQVILTHAIKTLHEFVASVEVTDAPKEITPSEESISTPDSGPTDQAGDTTNSSDSTTAQSVKISLGSIKPVIK